MDEELWYMPLDRLGEAFVGRSHRRRFVVQDYDPRRAEGIAFYVFLDDDRRIRLVEERTWDQEINDDGYGWQEVTVIKRREVESHATRPEELPGSRLPAGLKDYLDYLASIATPRMRWDDTTGRLFRDGEMCLEVRRMGGNGQIKILKALQAAGFSRPVENPFGDEMKLKYARRDFNDNSKKWAAEHNKKEAFQLKTRLNTIEWCFERLDRLSD
jgi:hypothetical protein